MGITYCMIGANSGEQHKQTKTDYWVSQGRKFCEFCKCSIADNKPSIQFHENGKKHRENVAKRLTEMQKKASKEAKDAVNFEKELKKIEAAALKAYAKDVGSGGDYTSHLIRSGLEVLPEVEPVETETKAASSKKGAEKTIEAGRKWREALSEEGRRYYWNSDTGESVWEPPKEGYVPLESRGSNKQKTGKQGNQRKAKKVKGKVGVKKESKDKGNSVKADEPVPFYRGHPYGTWKKVEPVKEETIDLQLPHQEMIPIAVPRLADEREKFKEKVVQIEAVPASTTEEAVFKKRKNVSDLRKNMRQRLNED